MMRSTLHCLLLLLPLVAVHCLAPVEKAYFGSTSTRPGTTCTPWTYLTSDPGDGNRGPTINIKSNGVSTRIPATSGYQQCNGNDASEQNHDITVPDRQPLAEGETPPTGRYCVGLLVGIMTDGIPLYNGQNVQVINDGNTRRGAERYTNAAGQDETWNFDACDRHVSRDPAGKGTEHYHYKSRCLPQAGFVGVALDGYAIYASSADFGITQLDECHGAMVGNEYRYFMDDNFPFSLGCFRGRPIRGSRQTCDGQAAGQLCVCTDNSYGGYGSGCGGQGQTYGNNGGNQGNTYNGGNQGNAINGGNQGNTYNGGNQANGGDQAQVQGEGQRRPQQQQPPRGAGQQQPPPQDNNGQQQPQPGQGPQRPQRNQEPGNNGGNGGNGGNRRGNGGNRGGNGGGNGGRRNKRQAGYGGAVAAQNTNGAQNGGQGVLVGAVNLSPLPASYFSACTVLPPTECPFSAAPVCNAPQGRPDRNRGGPRRGPDNRNPNDGNPANRSPNNGNPANGNPANGNPTNGNPTNGNPTNGNPTNGNPTNGNPANGIPLSGNPANLPVGNPPRPQMSRAEMFLEIIRLGCPADADETQRQIDQYQPYLIYAASNPGWAAQYAQNLRQIREQLTRLQECLVLQNVLEMPPLP